MAPTTFLFFRVYAKKCGGGGDEIDSLVAGRETTPEDVFIPTLTSIFSKAVHGNEI